MHGSLNYQGKGNNMPKPFHSLTLEEFDELLKKFSFARRIDAVHMHHTWRPNHAQYRGEGSIEAMWRYHTRENGWRDIAQHLSIAPDGTIWTGRDWNSPPASAPGYNGNRESGPFMFEIIGDFDQGCDRLEGAQRKAVLGVIARVQDKCSLPVESLRFHKNMVDHRKSCPGSGIEYQEILAETRKTREDLATELASRGADWGIPGSERENKRLENILRDWARNASLGTDPADAEPQESDMTPEQIRLITGAEGTTIPSPGSRGARGGGNGTKLTPAIMEELRPHVINMNQGRFSDEGLFQTAPEDVDTIFEDHLEQALRTKGRPLHLLFWAHGGLISEQDGLFIAHLQVQWWKKNNVYPIHFVWETGFCDALKQILGGAREMAAARGLPRDFWDYTTDPAVEAAARALGGAKIWGAMKESARLASDNGGAAAYTAVKLAEFCRKHPGEVELHAVGHSAGSIFHSWFLPRAFAAGAPDFATLNLLAPAIRMDGFNGRLFPLVGGKIRHLGMFTMKRDWEEDDNVAGIYRKSLLYLIYNALEPERKTPILGLENSVRQDPETAKLFGLKGMPSTKADVIWSVSQATTGSSASTSRTHGGFDNDRPTMNSVARRILGREDIIDFPEEAIQRGLGDIWSASSPFLPEFQHLFAPSTPPRPTMAAPHSQPDFSAPSKPSSAPGAQRALCIGIDAYPTMPLGGCVADARAWGSALEQRGFTITYLLNEQATRAAILNELSRLIAATAPGDVAVFQFSGHGTELEDLDRDEIGGTNGDMDEALCPYDIAQGAFVIDDDIAEVFEGIQQGTNVTCFIDCCHSGTIVRFMVGAVPGDDKDRRARYMPATQEMQDSHQAFRKRLGRERAPAKGTPDTMRQILFAACLDREVAYESSGQGEFTVRAVKILRQAANEMTNEEFQIKIAAAFGSTPRQHPDLDCAPGMRPAPLLRPPGFSPGRAYSTGANRADLAQALRTAADLLTSS